MDFQWEPELTFHKWSKNWNNGHLKQASLTKNAGKCPQNGSNSSFKKAWKWVSIFYLFCVTTLDWLCGTLVCKKKCWNEPKTSMPYISFLPNATKAHFDVLLLIWICIKNLSETGIKSDILLSFCLGPPIEKTNRELILICLTIEIGMVTSLSWFYNC